MPNKEKENTGSLSKAKKPESTTVVENFEVEPGWLNSTQMAASLGITLQAFTRWGVKPVAKRHKHGEAFYRVRDVLDNRLANQEKKLSRPEADMSAELLREEKDRAEIRLKNEQAEAQKLKNAVMRKERAPVEMIQWALSDAGSQIAAVLGTIKGKVKRAQPDLTNAALHEIEQITVTAQNVAADIRLDWSEFDESVISDPKSD